MIDAISNFFLELYLFFGTCIGAFFTMLLLSVLANIVVRKRLGSGNELSPKEKKGLRRALTALAAFAVMILYILVVYVGVLPYSPIDFSPLENLSEEEVARIEHVLPMFEYREDYFIGELKLFDEYREISHTYSIGKSEYHSQDGSFRGRSFGASITVWRSEDKLANSLGWTRSDHGNGTGGRRYRMDYPSATLRVFDTRQILSGDMRIGNVEFRLRESGSWRGVNNNFSNEFIELLVEMLQDDSLFEDSVSRESYE